MTLIVVTLALVVGHFAADFAQARRLGWIGAYRRRFESKLPSEFGLESILGLLLFMSLPVAAVALGQFAFQDSLRGVGGFVYALLILIYSWGPRDLDRDVTQFLEAEGSDERRFYANALAYEPLAVEHEIDPDAVVTAVTRQALQRWFAVFFYFVFLGPAGAFAYRVSCELNGLERHGENTLVNRWLSAIEWPVAQLMALGLAVADNFVKVIAHWKEQECAQTGRTIDPSCRFLYAATAMAVKDGLREVAEAGDEEAAARPFAPVRMVMQLMWRVLFVWLTLLAGVTLVDWVS